MPKLVNKNSHPIRVDKNGDGVLQRIMPGQVVDADGGYADRLTATAGVETASKDDVSRWDRKVENDRTKGAMPGDGSRLAAKMALGPQRQSLRMATIVAPLQRVLGDDAAPHGPASGTVTTRKEAALAGDMLDREAFARHDVLGLEEERVESAEAATNAEVVTGVATQDQIHNLQVDNAEAADEATKAYIGGVSGGVPTDGQPIEGDYDKHTSAELSAELQRRGLPDEGKKDDKIAALEADDEENA